MTLPFGKIPIDILKEIVFNNLGVKREEVTLGPSVGLDGAVIEIGDKSLVVSMDPLTGATERLGLLAVNINANDIATFGVKPSFFSSCILLPKNSDKKTIETICSQIDEAARDLGMAVTGGHCEVTPRLENPIVVGCAMGVADKGSYVTAAEARPKDKLIMTKSAGMEGTAILASDKEEKVKEKIRGSVLNQAKGFFSQISIVREAIIAFQTGGVNAMHDPTEGGVFGGIHEMADASSLGVRILEENISIRLETIRICKLFQIDPLQLVSSGALLISAKPAAANKIIERIRSHSVQASVIGEFTDDPNERLIRRKDGRLQNVPRPSSDHLWRALLQDD